MKRDGLVDELINATKDFPTYESLTELVAPYKNEGGSIVVFDDILTSLTKDFEQIFWEKSVVFINTVEDLFIFLHYN